MSTQPKPGAKAPAFTAVAIGGDYSEATTVKLADHAHRKAGALAHGQKQWLEIGMLLAQDPALLLVDEPFVGLDANGKTALVELLLDDPGQWGPPEAQGFAPPGGWNNPVLAP